jgi:hypothetical protein
MPGVREGRFGDRQTSASGRLQVRSLQGRLQTLARDAELLLNQASISPSGV